MVERVLGRSAELRRRRLVGSARPAPRNELAEDRLAALLAHGELGRCIAVADLGRFQLDDFIH
jgi:hypothetical protein